MSTVLVIDDEQGFLKILNIILQRAGYQTLLASNGAEGVELAEAHLPDLIILDDDMPDVTGGEVCTYLKGQPLTHTIPVVMYSGGARISDPGFVDYIGADAVLPKPAMPDEIVSMIDRYLRPEGV